MKFLPFFHFVLERAALPPFWFRFVSDNRWTIDVSKQLRKSLRKWINDHCFDRRLGLRVRTDQPAMGRFSPGSALLLILVSTVSVVYFHSKRCHCYKFQRRSYSKYGSKFIPQTGTFSELATRGRQICLTKTTANEKGLRLGSKARVFCGSQRRVALCRWKLKGLAEAFSLCCFDCKLETVCKVIE